VPSFPSIDRTPLPDRIYPNASPARRLIVILSLAAVTFGAMWLFR
jgi:hypothetical protein